MECSRTEQAWKLLEYSRFKPDSKLKVPSTGPIPEAKGQWIPYQVTGGKSKLVVSLKDSGYFMVTDGETVLESLFLLNASIKPRACKVLQKKDTLVFLYKFAGSKEIEGLALCKACASALSKYVNVRYAKDGDSQTSVQKESAPTTKGSGEPGHPSLSQLVQTIMNDDADKLPLIYRHTHMEGEKDGGHVGLEQMVMLCFTDPTFPTFVGEVEQILDKLVKSNEK